MGSWVPQHQGRRCFHFYEKYCWTSSVMVSTQNFQKIFLRGLWDYISETAGNIRDSFVSATLEPLLVGRVQEYLSVQPPSPPEEQETETNVFFVFGEVGNPIPF